VRPTKLLCLSPGPIDEPFTMPDGHTGVARSIPRLLLAAAVLVALQGCNYEVVDQAPAIAVADKFYGSLKNREGKAALALFAPAFKSTAKAWPRLLWALQERSGAVVSTELRGASLVANEDAPCYFLNYAVERDLLTTDESLLVCRAAGATNWEIVGHVLTRLDSKQSASAGVVPTEIGMKTP
jgi:hypothetical protein